MREARHIAAENIRLIAEASEADVSAVTVELGAGDTAWNPASTKTNITGPARVTYTFRTDGGIDTRVEGL